jgi:hypothetical protein
MPGFLGGSSGSSGVSGEIRFPAELIDPVTKIRVSEPQNLIDTDFEYGLQPTKWETVELINNTPSFFSASGDTTIPNLVDVITTAGSREVKVTTALAHGLAVGIPINVSGTKSITADGSYIINSVPDTTTFTYLCKQNQLTTASIVDLYTSIITGQFFQGSQIKISDSEGIITDAQGQSTLTIKTDSPHGFGVQTPFYFLNLNSTISQEFDSSNTGSKTFDSSNTATAQSFDGSNTLTSYPVDVTNNANTNGPTYASTVAAVNTTDDTITVTHTANENFIGKQIGTPLYYAVTASSGYFATNPRGVVYIATPSGGVTNTFGQTNSTFAVSATPGGTKIDLTVALTGTFQLATSARLFAGNNEDSTNQTSVDVIAQTAVQFDGANSLGSTSNVNSYSGTSILMTNAAGSATDTGLYVNAMVQYTTTGSAASGLTNNETYFITSFIVLAPSAPGLVQVQVSATPGGSAISISGGSGTQSFKKIGISTTRDMWHVPGHDFLLGDMVLYQYPSGGAIGRSNTVSDYMYVSKVYDSYNVQLKNDKGTTPDGLTAATAGVSAAQLKADNGYNTDGVYWITINNTPQQVYCIMDSRIDGGGWMMMMKATQGTTFSYSSSYWTSNNTLNTGDVNRNNGDAKFDVFNYFQGKDMLALWPDIGQGGSISASGYPWIWLQNNYYDGTRITPLSFFQIDNYPVGLGGSGKFIRDAKTFSGWAPGVFSSQADIRFYGFNYKGYSNNTGNGVRWGFGWNENSEGLFPSSGGCCHGSNDVSGGIGMAYGVNWSAGDRISCCQDSTGINRAARVELYVR